MSNQKNDILMVGTGGHARFVISVLNKISRPIKGLISVDEVYDPSEEILSNKIVGSILDLNYFYSMGYRELVLAIGDNQLRKDLFNKYSKAGFSFQSFIHPESSVDTSSNLGEGNIFGPQVVIGANVQIGNNNIFNSSCVIEHETIVGNHCHVAPGATICGRVVLGNEVLVGANSTILDKKAVASKTIVGAGSTLIESVIIESQVMVGSPARPI